MKAVLTFRATTALIERLRAQALEEDKTVTQVILDALYAYLGA